MCSSASTSGDVQVTTSLIWARTLIFTTTSRTARSVLPGNCRVATAHPAPTVVREKVIIRRGWPSVTVAPLLDRWWNVSKLHCRSVPNLFERKGQSTLTVSLLSFHDLVLLSAVFTQWDGVPRLRGWVLHQREHWGHHMHKLRRWILLHRGGRELHALSFRVLQRNTSFLLLCMRSREVQRRGRSFELHQLRRRKVQRQQ